jgi:hypothetical protein
VEGGPRVVGVSSAQPNSNVKLPDSFSSHGNFEKTVAIVGGQKFKLRLWTNGW